MSAFVCSAIQIGALASCFVHLDRYARRPADEIAREWARENLRSVDHLHQREPTPAADEAFIEECARYARDVYLNVPLIHLHKLLDCLEYQSCEHPEWEKSDAEALIRRARKVFIRAHPDWAEAPWGIDDARSLGPGVRVVNRLT